MPGRAFAPLTSARAWRVNDLPRQLQELLPLAGFDVEDVNEVSIRGVGLAVRTRTKARIAGAVAFNGCTIR
jgi:hypothetical protein